MPLLRRVAALVGCLGVLIACTETEPTPPTASSSGTTATRTEPSMPPLTVPTPQPDPALTTLLAAGPLEGSAIAGRTDVVAGNVLTSVNCLGPGELVVAVGSLGTFTISCPGG